MSNMVTEACHAGQFLQRHRSRVQDITCAPCPSGAYCAGLPSQNVTALQGYWRVPWAMNGLVFQQCPDRESCFGVVLDQSGQAIINSLIQDAEEAAALDVSNGTRADLGFNASASVARALQSQRVSASSSSRGSRRVASTGEVEASRLARTMRMSMTAADFQEVAVPDLVLTPPEIEGCDEGHDGLLCTTCAQGYTRTGNFRCR